MRTLMRILIFSLTLFSVIYSQEKPSKVVPFMSVRLGNTYGIQQSDFYDVYNDKSVISRPIYISDRQWEDFEPAGSFNNWVIEAGAQINSRLRVGVNYQQFSKNFKDELIYTSTITVNGVAEPLPGSRETYEFNTESKTILIFADFLLFKKGQFLPYLGIGIGATNYSHEWHWGSYASKKFGAYIWYEENDMKLMPEEKGTILTIQPRFRLAYKLPYKGIGKYIQQCYLQTDYIIAKYEADFFRIIRLENFNGKAFEELPAESQTESVKKLYQKYKVNNGGFQLMFGVEINFSTPGNN